MSSIRTAGWRPERAGLPIALLFVLLGSTDAAARGVDGRIGMGVEGDTARAPRSELEARLEYETGRTHGAKAHFEARASTSDRQVELAEAWVDLKPEDGGPRLRFGRGKKELGWEYEDSAEERLTLERSLPYELMEADAQVGRDYFLSVRRERFASSLHFADAGDLGAILRWASAEDAGVRLGGWLLVQWDRYAGGGALSWAAVAGLRSDSQRRRWAAELFAGIDPFRTEQQAAYGVGRRVHFLAGKLEYGLHLGAWMPYARLVALLPDLDAPGRDDLRALLGVRLRTSQPLVFAAEVELLGDDSGSLSTSRLWAGPVWRLEARYFLP